MFYKDAGRRANQARCIEKSRKEQFLGQGLQTKINNEMRIPLTKFLTYDSDETFTVVIVG